MSTRHPLSDSQLVVTANRRDALSSVPFPSAESELIASSDTSSSDLTSSDKLSALPAIQSSPALVYHRNPLRSARSSLEAAAPLSPLSNSPVMTSLSRFPTNASRESEGSRGKETPKQRVSFESERGSLPVSLPNLRRDAAGRVSRVDATVATAPSPGRSVDSPTHPRLRPNMSPLAKDAQTPTSRSPTQSRAASPLRFFGWNLHRNHSRDEPFIPVDPFQFHIRFFASPSSTPSRSSLPLPDLQCEDVCHTCLPLPATSRFRSRKLRLCGAGLRLFFLDTLPRLIYLHFLFRLPAMYFSRVSRIFEDAEVSKHEVQRMIEACIPADEVGDGFSTGAMGPSLSGATAGITRPPGTRMGGSMFPFPEEWNPPAVSPALARFKNSWEQFVDSLIREWKTLNLVSVLLCTALLTLFQIPDAAGDPLTRWSALFSLIFTIISLTYGCIYIVQFGTMRSMYKASRWAEEAQKSKTVIFWNIWVLLAMPAIWLAWSMTCFCVAILSYIWRTGSSSDPSDGTYPPLAPHQAFIVRALLTTVFGLGLVYFLLIVRTFSTYGESEADWRRSWLATAPGQAERIREMRREVENERGRRGRRGREVERDVAAAMMMTTPSERGGESKRGSPAMGLGLLGISRSGSGNNGASMAGVIQEDGAVEKEKGTEEVYVVEAVRGPGARRISPKL